MEVAVGVGRTLPLLPSPLEPLEPLEPLLALPEEPRVEVVVAELELALPAPLVPSEPVPVLAKPPPMAGAPLPRLDPGPTPLAPSA